MVNSYNNSIAYRSEVDGLRAVALLPVIFFHAGFEIFSGGFVGVDVFFVISGYLITSIILRELSKGQFSIVRFYERRARRILPALIFVILCCFPFAWLWMLPNELERFGLSVIAVATFSSNIYFWRSTDYFSPSADENPLLHTWSLAVEEQYYVIFPLLLMLFWRFGKRRLFIIISVVALISLFLSELGWRYLPVGNFYLLPSRAWELLAGSLLAFIPKRYDFHILRSKLFNEVCSMLGLILVIYSVLFFDNSTPFPSIYALIPVLGAVLIIYFARSGTVVASLLSSQLFVGIGLISYSAYLWHQPLFAFAKIKLVEPSEFVMFFLIALSFGLAWFSWKFVESYFRNALVFRKKQVFLFSTSALFVLFSTGGAMYWNADRLSNFTYGSELSKYGGEGWGFGLTNTGFMERPQFILYGDSHAKQYAPTLATLAKSKGVSWVSLLHSACLSLPQLTSIYKGEQHSSCSVQIGLLNDNFNGLDSNLIIAQRWSKLIPKDASDTDGVGRVGSSPNADEIVLQALRHFLEISKETFKTVTIIGNVPGSGLLSEGGYMKCIRAQAVADCPKEFPIGEGELAVFNKKLFKLASEYDYVGFINPYDYLCDKENCSVTSGAELLYSDHAHLSKLGAQNVINGSISILSPIIF